MFWVGAMATAHRHYGCWYTKAGVEPETVLASPRGGRCILVFHVEHAQASMASELRLLRLEVVGRLRRAGWIPPTLLAVWIAVALLQEPLVLRLYGIAVCPQGAWVGAALCLPLYITPCRILGDRDTWVDRFVSFVAVVVLGVAQAGAVALGELLWYGRTELLAALGSAAIFAVAWIPVAAAVGRSASDHIVARWWGRGIITACTCVGAAVGHTLWTEGPSLAPMMASLLATVAGAFGTRAMNLSGPA